MGGFAGAAGARRRLTRWAFTLADVRMVGAAPVALVLSPAAVAKLPLLTGLALTDAARGGVRSVARRQVFAALARRAVPGAAPFRLETGADGRRRMAGTAWYASASERNGWVAAVLSPEAVGIDLEDVAEAANTAVVLDGIDAAEPAEWHGLAGLWTAREATLKAMGRDLTTDPGEWCFAGGFAAAAGWPPHRVDLVALPGLVAAVAYAGG